jgi:exosortase E/protease (VPEID-CTERM system)
VASEAIPVIPSGSWLLRWSLSIALLVASLLVVSLPVPQTGLWWVRLPLSDTALLVPFPTRFLTAGLVITTITATILLGWPAFRQEVRRTLADSGSTDVGWIGWLALYVATVFGLANLTLGDAESTSAITLHIVGAAMLTGSALVSWCLAAMPLRFWLGWMSRNFRLLPAVAVVSLVTYAIGHHYTPLAMACLSSFTGSLQRSTLLMSAHILPLFVKDVVFEPANRLIGTQNFSVYIDPQCAGWEGIELFATFFSIYLWLYRSELRFPHVLMLLPIGVAVLWWLNVIRVVALILVGNWSDSLGMEGFHSVAGWLFFNSATLGLVATSRRLRLFSKNVPNREAFVTSNPATPYLVPLMMITVTGMITRLFLYHFDVLYPIVVIVGAIALWYYRKRIPFQWNVSWWAAALGFLAFAVWVILRPGDSSSATAIAINTGLDSLSTAGAVSWLLFRVVGAALIFPIAEELAFRGYALRKLVSADFEAVSPGHFSWLSFLGSSVLFGAFHGQWLTGTLVGMVFATAVYHGKSLSDAIVSHCSTGLLLVGYVLATRHWSLLS